jgi:hypothetical protein
VQAGKRARSDWPGCQHGASCEGLGPSTTMNVLTCATAASCGTRPHIHCGDPTGPATTCTASGACIHLHMTQCDLLPMLHGAMHPSQGAGGLQPCNQAPCGANNTYARGTTTLAGAAIACMPAPAAWWLRGPAPFQGNPCRPGLRTLPALNYLSKVYHRPACM